MVEDRRYELQLDANVDVSRIELWIIAEDDLEWTMYGVYRPSSGWGPSHSPTVSFLAPTSRAWGQFRMWFESSTISGQATIIEVSMQPD
jgi:hypothetical protein